MGDSGTWMRNIAAHRSEPILRALLQVLEARFAAQDLLVQPAIDDTLPKAPLFSQLRRGNPLFLCPLVDGLRRESQIRGDFLDRQHLVVGTPDANLATTPGA